jgi:hypothetical protein
VHCLECVALGLSLKYAEGVVQNKRIKPRNKYHIFSSCASTPVNMYYLTKSDKAYLYEVHKWREIYIYIYIHTHTHTHTHTHLYTYHVDSHRYNDNDNDKEKRDR